MVRLLLEDNQNSGGGKFLRNTHVRAFSRQNSVFFSGGNLDSFSAFFFRETCNLGVFQLN